MLYTQKLRRIDKVKDKYMLGSKTYKSSLVKIRDLFTTNCALITLVFFPSKLSQMQLLSMGKCCDYVWFALAQYSVCPSILTNVLNVKVCLFVLPSRPD
uniref:Uncharacterized protein n=1 Tax=Pararge aegeria TaxID=116150 RepID=S4NN25_9NEOP